MLPVVQLPFTKGSARSLSIAATRLRIRLHPPPARDLAGSVCQEQALCLSTHVQPECIESLVCPRTERACTQPLLLGKGTNGLMEISLGAENVFVKWPLAFTTEGYL